MRQSKMFSDVEWEVLLSIKSLNEILEVFFDISLLWGD